MQQKTITKAEYANAKMLTGTPKRPRLHLARGSGSEPKRRHSTQPILSMYVLRRLNRAMDAMMLKARVEPRGIKLNKAVMTEAA
jgi:hypothetical protein